MGYAVWPTMVRPGSSSTCLSVITCCLPDSGAPEEDAALYLCALFHSDAGEEDGVHYGALDAAALSHQGVQAHAVRSDVGRGLVGALGPDWSIRRKEVLPDLLIQKLHGAVVVLLHGALKV